MGREVNEEGEEGQVCRVGGGEMQRKNRRWCVGERNLQVGMRWVVEVMEEGESYEKGE